MNILIFDDCITGHHLEYLHHLYSAVTERQDATFFFLLPEEFKEAKGGLQWRGAENAKFFYLTNKEQKLCSQSSLLRSAWHKSVIIRNFTQKHSIDKIWLIIIMQFMPFLPILLPRKVKVSGILYRIYLYEESNMSKVRVWLEKIRYHIMIVSKSVENILVLNDEWSAEKLNKLYHTKKFKFLPDPIPFIDDSKVRNIRSELGISEKSTLFLHFGSMDYRKGSLDILRAIKLLSNQDLSKMAFVFAGKITESLHDDFYDEYNVLRKKACIRVYDDFCSYEFLSNLCYSCNCILIPYKSTNQSSGVIGYAAHFRKPVLGPMGGLVGRLIVNYSMGLALPQIDEYHLAQAMKKSMPHVENNYAESHRISSFVEKFS